MRKITDLELNKDPKSIAVLTIMIGNHDYYPLTKKNHTRYCNKHKYPYVLIDKIEDLPDITRNEAPTWSKISKAIELFDKYDYVFWMDADSIFTNMEIRLEKFMAFNKDFIFSGDTNIINAGHWLINNSNWSRRFLRDLLKYDVNAMYEKCSPLEDNTAFAIKLAGCPYKAKDKYGIFYKKVDIGYTDKNWERLIREADPKVEDLLDPALKDHVKIIPKRKINSYRDDWQHGDFILHLAGKPNETKLKDLKNFEKQCIY